MTSTTTTVERELDEPTRVSGLTSELAAVAASIRRELLFNARRREREAIANLARGIRDVLALDEEFFDSCGLDSLGYASDSRSGSEAHGSNHA